MVVRVVGFNYPYYPNYRLYFRETPPPPLKQNLTVVRVVGFNYPYYPNYHLYLKRDPTPTLGVEPDGNYPYYPNYRLFFSFCNYGTNTNCSEKWKFPFYEKKIILEIIQEFQFSGTFSIMEMVKISGSFPYVNRNPEFRWKPYPPPFSKLFQF